MVVNYGKPSCENYAFNQRITMINNKDMTMRLTMVNLAAATAAKGNRNQCTTSLTL